MPILVRWRGTDLPNGSDQVEGQMYPGTAGVGDTEGPTYVDVQGGLQSDLYVRPTLFRAGEGPHRAKAIQINHFINVPCWVGWSFPVQSSGYRFRFYLRMQGVTAPDGGRWPLLSAWGPDGDGVPNSVMRWSLDLQHDTLAPNGRKLRLWDRVANAGLAPHNYQLGGTGGFGPVHRIEGRVSPTGLLEMACFHEGVDPDVPRAYQSLQLTQWDVDTFSFGARPHPGGGTGSVQIPKTIGDIEVWDEWTSNSWKGPYTPQPMRFERVIDDQGGTQRLEIEGVLTAPGVVTPVGALVSNRERVLPPFVLHDEVSRTDVGGPAIWAGRALGDIYLPDPEAYAGPHPFVLWGHSGFFQRGSHNTLPVQWAGALCAAGYAVIAYRYPFVDAPGLFGPNDYNGKTKHPMQVRSAKSQFKYVQDNAATWNLDPAKGFMCGYSAGGNLSLASALSYNLADFNGHDMRLMPGVADTYPQPLGVFTYAAPVNWQRARTEDSTGFIAVHTAKAYMGGWDGSASNIADGASLHLLPELNAANIGSLKVGYVLGTQDELLSAGQEADIAGAMTAAGLGSNYQGHMIVAGHDNIDTVNQPNHSTNGIIPWLNGVLGGGAPVGL